MARNKKPRKKYCAPRGIKLQENVAYWLPINYAIAVQCGSYTIAAASDDYLSDELTAAVLQPVSAAIAALRNGEMQFVQFWNLLQGTYLMAHICTYALEKQKYRIYARHTELGEALNDVAVERFLQPVRECLYCCENDYPEAIEAIGQRQKRTGNYGASGNDLKLLDMLYADLESLVSWCSVKMLYHASMKCCRNIEQIEQQLHKKTKLMG